MGGRDNGGALGELGIADRGGTVWAAISAAADAESSAVDPEGEKRREAWASLGVQPRPALQWPGPRRAPGWLPVGTGGPDSSVVGAAN